jgi:hypothetical protein
MKRTIAILLAFALVFPSLAQQPAHTGPPVYVTAIDLIVDVRDRSGNLPAGLTPADFILVEEGVERKVVGVDYLRAERKAPLAADVPAAPAPATSGAAAAPAPEKLWQTVLYFETQLSGAAGRQRIVAELDKQIDALVQMGTVDVILADPSPSALVRSSRDPEAIRKALSTVAAKPGINQLVSHRRRYLRERHEIASLADIKRNLPPSQKIEMGQPGPPRADFDKEGEIVTGDTGAKTIRPFIDEEVQLIKRFRSDLLTWVSNYRRHIPRTLVVVTDGFDIDPLEFYSADLNQGDEMNLRTHVAQHSLSESATRLAETLAASGWTTISVPADNAFSDGWVDDASTSAIGRVHRSTTTPKQKGSKALLYRPIEPLGVIAETTGGSVVANSAKLGAAIAGIGDRIRITYQVDRKPDGKARRIEVRPRDRNLTVRSAQWASSSTPDEMAEVRALNLLNDGGFAGELPVRASIAWSAASGRKKGMLEASADMTETRKLLPPGARGDFRFTLAIRVPEKGNFVTNHLISGYKMDDGSFRVKTPVDFPDGTSAVVVVVEEINTSMWGSATVR